jgi:predicted HNH restriction endonuclease
LPLPFEYNKLDESDIFLGGNILLQYHKYIESRTDVAKLMKRELINRKTSSCYICCNNLLETYGEKAFQMLEMHYAAEIHEIHRDITVLSSKFVSVCPNCHTISHSDIDLFEENKLKEYIEQQRRGAKYV